MFVMAAKAGLGFAVMLALLGAVQADSAFSGLLLFMTVGLIPGTNVELPADVMLLAVGAALMGITVLFCRRYYSFHTVLDAVMPEYIREDVEDPDFSSLVPSLGRLRMAGNMAVSAINNASLQLYFWFKYFGRPTIAQTIVFRRGFDSAFVRLDRWAAAKFGAQTDVEKLGDLSREWSRRAKAYLMRVTML